MTNPFPWGWFLFWLIVCAPIAFLIVLVRAPQAIIVPIGVFAIIAFLGVLLQ